MLFTLKRRDGLAHCDLREAVRSWLVSKEPELRFYPPPSGGQNLEDGETDRQKESGGQRPEDQFARGKKDLQNLTKNYAQNQMILHPPLIPPPWSQLPPSLT